VSEDVVRGAWRRLENPQNRHHHAMAAADEILAAISRFASKTLQAHA